MGSYHFLFNVQVPFLFGFPALEKLAAIVIHLIFRRTGRHLFLTDCDEGTLPLLLRMLGDFNDLFFMYFFNPYQF